MRRSSWRRTISRLVAVTTLGTATLACGGGEEPRADPATTEPAATAAAAPEAAPAESDDASVGELTFTVDGEQKTFPHLADSENFYSRMTSALHAQPSPGSTELLVIRFMGMDIGEPSYPAELPVAKDPASMTPRDALANVGFSYTDAGGVEWAGPGKVRVESFADGVLRGGFEEVSLPHTDGERPAVVLAGGSFEARLGGSG